MKPLPPEVTAAAERYIAECHARGRAAEAGRVMEITGLPGRDIPRFLAATLGYLRFRSQRQSVDSPDRVHGNTGVPRPAEVRRKISESKTGRAHAPSHRQAISLGMKLRHALRSAAQAA